MSAARLLRRAATATVDVDAAMHQAIAETVARLGRQPGGRGREAVCFVLGSRIIAVDEPFHEAMKAAPAWGAYLQALSLLKQEEDRFRGVLSHPLRTLAGARLRQKTVASGSILRIIPFGHEPSPSAPKARDGRTPTSFGLITLTSVSGITASRRASTAKSRRGAGPSTALSTSPARAAAMRRARAMKCGGNGTGARAGGPRSRAVRGAQPPGRVHHVGCRERRRAPQERRPVAAQESRRAARLRAPRRHVQRPRRGDIPLADQAEGNERILPAMHLRGTIWMRSECRGGR